MLNFVIALLAAAVVLVPLAKRLGLGAIVGYLLAGVLVGPGVLGVIEEVDEIAHISELGVAMMLFVIGLELEPKRLWAMRRDVFGAGTMQMLACGGALSLIALAAGLGWKAALLVGLALALSSTAIAVQLMTERHVIATPTGSTAFGILLFQDLAAIPLIALVALLSAAPGPQPGGMPFWQSLAVFAAAIAVGRSALGPLFRRIAGTGMREIFTAAALLLVLGMAGLMQWAGFSLALGAFLAGVLLADSEYRKALETDIEPFKGLLLGLFFLTVGAGLDLSVLRAQWPLVVAVAGVLFATKFAVLAALARPLGVPAPMRLTFAAVVAQAGEFALVVFSAARAGALLDATQANVLNSAVAVSMALTPLALSLAERLAARVQTAPPASAEDIHADYAPVVIAGFGRMGQIAARLLFAHGIRANVLDRDPEQIGLISRFGYKVFYGDATRLDLLRAAGASDAKVLVNAIDDVDANLALVDLAREYFPHLAIVSRARNVRHLFELRKRSVAVIERETFESALRLGRGVLETLGVAPYDARVAADAFRRHNVATLEAMYLHYGDEERLLTAARAARDEFEQSFQRDRTLAGERSRAGWTTVPERAAQRTQGRGDTQETQGHRD